METIGEEIRNTIIDGEKLMKAIENLDKDKIIHISQIFINNNPDSATKEIYKKAMKEGVALVAKKFESGDYNIKDIVAMRDILEEVLSMIATALPNDEV